MSSPARPLASLLVAAVLSAACGARSGLNVAPDAPDAPAPDAPTPDAAPVDAAVCSCRTCVGSCFNVPGCPNGLCRAGRCFPRCGDGRPCPAGTACGTVLDCDLPETVCR